MLWIWFQEYFGGDYFTVRDAVQNMHTVVFYVRNVCKRFCLCLLPLIKLRL